MYLPTQRGFDTYLGVPYSIDMGGLPPHGVYGGCPFIPLLLDDAIHKQPLDIDKLAEDYADYTTHFIKVATRCSGAIQSGRY